MTDLTILQTTKFIIKCLLISTREELTIKKLNYRYAQQEGKGIPFSKLGYSSLIQFLKDIPDIVDVDFQRDIVRPVTSNKSAHISKFVSEQRSPIVNRRQRFQNPKVFNSPITSGQLKRWTPSQYSTINRKTQSTNDCISSDVQVEEIVSKGIKPSRAIENVRNNKTGTVEAIPPMDDDDPIHTIECFNSNFGIHIPETDITNFDVGTTITILISEINCPWKFWFHMTQNLEEITYIEDELRSNYMEMSNKHYMHTSQMVVGNACAVHFNNKWLRGEFVERPIENNVKVYFVDYGTTCIVEVSKLRMMYQYLCSIPKLAYRGVLHFINPNEDRNVKMQLTKCFVELAQNKPLVAVVTGTDFDEKIIHMVVIDTNSQKMDLIINKELLNIVAQKQRFTKVS